MKNIFNSSVDHNIKEHADALQKTPSSYAATMYDKYGEAGVDALKEAWEEVL